MYARRYRTKVKKSYLAFIISVISIIFFTLVGICFANYNNISLVNYTVSTGCLDVSFKECSAYKQSSDSVCCSVYMSQDKKNMTITLNNVSSGYMATFKYKIENKSTIPIVCKTEALSDNPNIEIIVQNSEKEIMSGSIYEGDFTVRVKSVQEGKAFNSSIYLNFRQYFR